MKIIFDTSAFIAFEVQNDLNHAKAKTYFESLKKKRAVFFTNDYVLDETYTRLIYDIHLKAAESFYTYILDLLEKRQLTLLEVEPSTRKDAWQQLLHYPDHKLSFTDATIISQFIEYNLDEIFTFDSHFRNINLPTNLA